MSDIIEFSSEELQKAGASAQEAEAIVQSISKNIEFGANYCWQDLIRGPLHPDTSKAVLQYVYRKLFRLDAHPEACPPAWIPDSDRVQNSNIFKVAQELKIETYDEFFKWAACNRAGFWDLTVRKYRSNIRSGFRVQSSI